MPHPTSNLSLETHCCTLHQSHTSHLSAALFFIRQEEGQSVGPSEGVLLAVLELLIVAPAALVTPAATLALVQELEGLLQVALEGCESCADSRAPEAVGQETEVGQAALDPRLQARHRTTRPQGRAVLRHQLHKLLTHLPNGEREKGLEIWRCTTSGTSSS